MKNAMFLMMVGMTIFTSAAFPDVIYFKDGGKAEGMIKADDGQRIILELGIGTMSVRKDDIDHIDKASDEYNKRFEKEKLSREISSGEWAPLGWEKVRLAYLKAKGDKEVLIKSRARNEAVKNAINAKEENVVKWMKVLAEKGKQMKLLEAGNNVREYNSVVAEINSINANLSGENLNLKNLYEEQRELDSNVSKKAHNYLSDYRDFKEILKTKQDEMQAAEASADESVFSKEMRNKAAEMENDFKENSISYIARHDQVIVDVLLENSVSARLIVDTGASIIVITKNIADKLGIKSEEIGTKMEVILANGTKAEAVPFILKSVKVGEVEAKNIRAAITENGPGEGADGLLGMSFLNNFIIRVDTSSNRLILEQVL
ncbi:MAG: retropepsin-like aspartic protease [Candidatus Omnitrophica bacterium]|nr:retropepsin-like aspartic protease [Candidatus Omnitrophota bacterium]